jgi:hypothetical protein
MKKAGERNHEEPCCCRRLHRDDLELLAEDRSVFSRAGLELNRMG